MPMISWPFDSTVTEDGQGNPVYSRVYSAGVLSSILRKYFRNGVFASDANAFQVSEGTGMAVSVAPGHCLINGKHGYNDAAQSVAIAAADPSLPRIDVVVLRLDLGVSALDIRLAVVAGTPAVSPAAPALTRNSTVYELALAEVLVGTGVTSLPSGKITDTRLDSTRCGVVASIIGDTDTSTFYMQVQSDFASFKAVEQAAYAAWATATESSMEGWIATEQAAFEAWFSSVQTALGDDTAGNLLNLINKYKARNGTVTLAVADWVAGSGVYTQTKAASIVPANCVLHASPVWASREAYNDAECGVSAASAGSVTFTATSAPTVELSVNLSVSEVDA